MLKKEDGTYLAESMDIAEHLATMAGPPLMPTDEVSRNKAKGLWECYDAVDKPYNSEALPSLNIIDPILNFFPVDDAGDKLTGVIPGFTQWMATLEEELGDGPFFGGEFPVYSEFAVLHLIDNFCSLEGGVILHQYPKLEAWYNIITDLPEIDEYMQNRPQSATGFGVPGSIMATCPNTFEF